MSRVEKRVSRGCQEGVKRVSRECQMDVNRESKNAKRVPRGCQEGVKDSEFVRAWASCQEVQCAERSDEVRRRPSENPLPSCKGVCWDRVLKGQTRRGDEVE